MHSSFFNGAGAAALVVTALLAAADSAHAQAATQVRESNQAGARLGWSVASAGDVNNDTYLDVIAGAPGWSNGQASEGRVFVYLGASSGIQTTPAWSYESNQAGAVLGSSVASGDANGDGYGDVIVGAPGWDGSQVDEGRALVFLGGSSGLPTTPSWTSSPGQAGAAFGSCVASAAKVNTSAYSAILVGAPLYDGGQTDEGKVFAYYGSSSGPSTTAGWSIESNQAAALLGESVASAGDVNEDGYDEIIVGAAADDVSGLANAGRATLYNSGSGGISTSASWTGTGSAAYAYFGAGVATAGDVNRDGKFDVAVGAWCTVSGETSTGRTYVYHGSSSGLASSPARTLTATQADSALGWSGATAGKFDGDNYWDLAVGEPLYDGAQTDAGRISVFYGANSGIPASPAWTSTGTQVDGQVGMQVANAGDVNKDGRMDLIVGVPSHSNGQAKEGAIRVYFSAAP